MGRKRKQAGGYLRGPSHERGGIPANVLGAPPVELEGGEYIINAQTVNAVGTQFLDELNSTSTSYSQGGFQRGQLPNPSRYKKGGKIGRKLQRGGNTNQSCISGHTEPNLYPWLDGVNGGLDYIEFEEPVGSGNFELFTPQIASIHCDPGIINHGQDLVESHIQSFVNSSTRFARLMFHFNDGTAREPIRNDYEKEFQWFNSSSNNYITNNNGRNNMSYRRGGRPNPKRKMARGGAVRGRRSVTRSMARGGRTSSRNRKRFQRGGNIYSSGNNASTQRRRIGNGRRVRSPRQGRTRRSTTSRRFQSGGQSRGGNMIQSGNRMYSCPPGSITITENCAEITPTRLQWT